jgi:hypothetical protein
MGWLGIYIDKWISMSVSLPLTVVIGIDWGHIFHLPGAGSPTYIYFEFEGLPLMEVGLIASAIAASIRHMPISLRTLLALSIFLLSL